MLFQEPQRTEYDVHFQFLGIPVRVHPFFWILVLLLGIRGNDSRGILIWVAVCFVSILVHEMGHALTIRYFGWSPHVVLYSFGGLAIYDPSFSPVAAGRRRRRNAGAEQVLISLAGPAAGFLLAALTLLAIQAAGHDALLFLRSLMTRRPVSLVVNDSVTDLVASLLYVNVYWGLLNLLPIFPLDGGRVARELLLAKSHDGVRQSLMLSFVTAVVVAALALLRWQQTYVAIMFGFMAYSNYTQLSGPFGGSFGGPGRYRPW